MKQSHGGLGTIKKSEMFSDHREMSVRKGVIGKWWAPNYYHLSANLHRTIRTLAIKRAPYLRSSEGHHNVRWAVTQPLNYWVKRCSVGLIANRFRRLHVYGKLTCVWKVNDYFQSWSWVTETAAHYNSPSAISPFRPREPSDFKNVFIDFWFAFVPQFSSELFEHFNESCAAKSLTSNSEWPSL